MNRRDVVGQALLAVAVVFAAVGLGPELLIGRFPPNDAVLHLAASERLGTSFGRSEPFFDPWVSEWALGYPFWRSYQPLPHLIAAIWIAIAKVFGIASAPAFAALQYLLLVLLPASIYGGARLFGLSRGAAGIAALLILAPSAAGDLDRYGLSFGATTWRGSGLYTQVFAVHLLAWAVGVVARALDGGPGRVRSALLLAGTALSHIVFAYVGFVSAALLALAGPKGGGPRRFVRLAEIAAPALLLIAWFIVPLSLVKGDVNHSRFEAMYKWDSFGARYILETIASGAFFDQGRGPWLSMLVLAGVAAAALTLREALSRRLLLLAATWLALFFGRETWGHLLALAGVPGEFHLHRLQGAFELYSVLLAAYGVERAVRRAFEAWPPLGVASSAALAAVLVAIGADRAGYLEKNAEWGRGSVEAIEREKADLDAAMGDVRALVGRTPGRVTGGPAASWGGKFTVGSSPMYAFLTREHFDQVSFLYHAMSLTSDVMVLRDENDAAHDVVFAVRAVVAPADRPAPAHLRQVGLHGRFAVYESSPEGYFGLVDVGARYVGTREGWHDTNVAWLKSEHLRTGIVAALEPYEDKSLPAFERWTPLPTIPPALNSPRGRILSEVKEGETYRARVAMDRAAHAFLKITFHPDLRAEVDGKPSPVVRVTPGFAAIPVPAGEHEIAVRYAPGGLKGSLLAFGAVIYAWLAAVLRRSKAGTHWWGRLEARTEGSLAAAAKRLSTPVAAVAASIAALAILALRPLLRGRLADGHDALEYPPRVVEYMRAIADGHLPPVWAADLGAGHGQPLFGFAPPLVYLTALPFRAIGFGLADSIQLGLFALHTAGAAAVYALARRVADRPGAVACAALWLFGPYVALDLFVRGAFAEASAVAAAPIALWGLLAALDRPTPARIAASGLAIALVPLAHNAAALLLFGAFALVVAARAASNARPLPAAGAGAASLLLGLGASAFFWAPALFEKGLVKTDLLRADFLHWRDHIISPLQLLWSPWGYGLSLPGSGDGMSFAIGPLHIVAAFIGAHAARRRIEKERRFEALAFGIAALAGAFLATSWSALFWAHVETLQYMAFPWRALLLPAAFIPILAAYGLARISTRTAALVIAAIALANLSHADVKRFLVFDDAYYTPRSIAEKGMSTSTREEYEPRWVERRPPFAPVRLRGIDRQIGALALEVKTQREVFEVTSDAPVRVESALFYFPGWTAAVDGAEVAIAPQPVTGLIAFDVPAGKHRVVLELRQTPLRRWSSAVSAAALSLCLGVLIAAGRRGRGAARSG